MATSHAAINVQSLVNYMKSIQGLRIPECPLEPTGFSQFRVDLEREMKVLELDVFISKPFNQFMILVWKEKEPRAYYYEKQLLIYSGFEDEKHLDELIIDPEAANPNWDGGTGTKLIEFERVSANWEQDRFEGRRITRGKLLKHIEIIKNMKIQLIREYLTPRKIAYTILGRAIKANHNELLIDEHCKDDPYLTFEKLLEKQMQHSSKTKNLWIAQKEFHSISMNNSQISRENFNKYVQQVMEKSELLNSLRPGTIGDEQRTFRLIDGLPEGKMKEHAELYMKTRPDINFTTLVSLLSEEITAISQTVTPVVSETTQNTPTTMANAALEKPGINRKSKPYMPKWKSRPFKKRFNNNYKRFNQGNQSFNRRFNHRQDYRPREQRFYQDRKQTQKRQYEDTDHNIRENRENKRGRNEDRSTYFKRPERSFDEQRSHSDRGRVNTVIDIETGCDRVYSS